MYDDEGVDLSLRSRLRTNQDKQSKSAYFTQKRKQKIQFGDLSEASFELVKKVYDTSTGTHGIHLNFLDKKIRKWWKNFEIDLLLDVKQKRKEWGLPKLETHELQHTFRSSILRESLLEVRLSKDPTYWALDEEFTNYEEVDVVEEGSLLVPIMQFVGLWINEDDDSWGLVVECSDIMVFPNKEEEEETDEEDVEVRKRRRVDSPVQSVAAFSVAEQSLYPHQFD